MLRLAADPALGLGDAGVAAGWQEAPPSARPCQLPPDIGDFTGRDELVAELQEVAAREEGRPVTALVVSVITGKAGVGKTALAVRVAHELRPSFPDGQLYVNLRGAEAQPLDPADVLAGFLRALGVDGTAIPNGVEERLLCGCLPLTLRIAGARLASKRHWRLARLAERLDDERRLDELTAGDLEVRASVALSYQGLREDERRVFRLLALLEAPDFAAWTAAALLDTSPAQAEEAVERLVDAQLLEVAGEDKVGQTRYRSASINQRDRR